MRRHEDAHITILCVARPQSGPTGGAATDEPEHQGNSPYLCATICATREVVVCWAERW